MISTPGGQMWRLIDTAWQSALVGSSFLGVYVISPFLQVAGDGQKGGGIGDVSFSGAEIALIAVILAPIAGCVTFLTKSLLASKDETIKIQTLELSAMNIRLNDGLAREVGLQGQLSGAFVGDLRESRDTMHELVNEVKNSTAEQKKANEDGERRHNQFIRLMTSGDRRAIAELQGSDDQRNQVDKDRTNYGDSAGRHR